MCKACAGEGGRDGGGEVVKGGELGFETGLEE